MKISQGDIVMVPFPYSDLSSTKTRPALVISNTTLQGADVILAGITSHKTDHGIVFTAMDLEKGGLPLTSYVKIAKVISLEKSLVRSVEAKIGMSKMKEIVDVFSKFTRVI